jgi:hypothetical protein
MPTSTGTLDTITSFTLTTGLQSVAFSNLPQNYQTLVLTMGGKYSNSGQSYLRFTPNGNLYNQYQQNSYSLDVLAPNSGSATISFAYSAPTTQGFANITPDAGNISMSTELMLINYSSSAGNKTALFDSRQNSTGGYGGIGLSTVTSELPITSFVLNFDAGTFAAGTSFTLYGVSGHQLKATGGDVIQTDGAYWYHAFKSSGTFTPVANMTADILVVAGGAGGGAGKGGGGGAGGVCYLTSGSLTADVAYSAVIGAGGAGGNLIGSPRGTNGVNSTFFGITANGGGGGASDYGAPDNNGLAGGSGGGATRGGSVGATNQGTSGGATGYGFNGGLGYNSNPYSGGGGGGSGVVGGNATSTVGGAGGNGKNTWASWLAVIGYLTDYIAGGGGGSSYGSGINVQGGEGGLGGGGSGATYNTTNNSQAGLVGVVNSGSGGGGGSDGGVGGAGGSGLVIVRYAV